MTAEVRRLSELAEIPVSRLRGVGPDREAALGSLGIETVFDLLTTYPRRWIDRTRRVDLSDLTVGEEVAVLGEVMTTSSRRTKRGKPLVEITVADDSGSVSVVFFNQPWRAHQLAIGTQGLFFGKITEYRGRRQMTNPVVDVLVGASGREREATRIGRVVPIYPASGRAGITSWEMGGYIEESLRRAGQFLDPVPEVVRERHDLIGRTEAFQGIHLPSDGGEKDLARRRLVFDEFFRLQVLLAMRRARSEASSEGVSHPARLEDLTVTPGAAALGMSLVARFLSGHRYELTRSQRQVLAEIFDDLSRPQPMHRLLQGDVGSGKTTVALAALLSVIEGGRQGALMAPTEVLAEQHVAALRADLEGLTVDDRAVLGGTRPISVQLLTGRVPAKERRLVLEQLADGRVDIVVGTHALLTEDVYFRSLGLVVIDEQHRFGVEQRATLREKGRAHSTESLDPDLLVMTATPIPRTAALVLFSDLDISTVDEMPAGREPAATEWLALAEDAERAWDVVRRQVSLGHRGFVVCPLVEGSDRIEAASATEEFERLETGPLHGCRLGLLHGQMRGAEKDEVMGRFRRGELDVLVATVVIEVGVDVPEATVMVIEDAWRFGLAQLHQLRGRVGRGGGESWCFLLGAAPSPDAEIRLQALVDTSDGFELAEVDMLQRGEGTLLGARQRGRSDLRLANLIRDADLLEAAKVAAHDIVDSGRLVGHDDLVDELRLFIDEDEADFLFKS